MVLKYIQALLMNLDHDLKNFDDDLDDNLDDDIDDDDIDDDGP